MAEIKIQRKKSKAWIWLLLLIVAIVLIWLYFNSIDNDVDEVETDNAYETENVVEQEYVMFLDTLDTNVTARSGELQSFTDSAEVDVKNYYVLNGLRSLSKSLNAIVNNQDVSEKDLREERNVLDRAVRDIDRDTSNTRLYKNGIRSAVNLMKSIQEKVYPQLEDEMKAVTESADKITGEVPFKEQHQEVKTFFDTANQLVQVMKKDTPVPEKLRD